MIAMVDLLISDLAKESADAKTQETDSQADYEQLRADSAETRKLDTKSLTAKGAAKAKAIIEEALGGAASFVQRSMPISGRSLNKFEAVRLVSVLARKVHGDPLMRLASQDDFGHAGQRPATRSIPWAVR